MSAWFYVLSDPREPFSGEYFPFLFVGEWRAGFLPLWFGHARYSHRPFFMLGISPVFLASLFWILRFFFLLCLFSTLMVGLSAFFLALLLFRFPLYSRTGFPVLNELRALLLLFSSSRWIDNFFFHSFRPLAILGPFQTLVPFLIPA